MMFPMEGRDAHTDRYMEPLKKSGKYDTHQRRIILSIIKDSANKHSSFADIARKTKRVDPKIGKVTVYRTLAHLARHDVVTSYVDKKGITRYELPRRKHIHIVCDRCNKIQEYASDRIESLIRHDLAARKFDDSNCSILITATCGHCRNKKS